MARSIKILALFAVLFCGCPMAVRADVVTEWNAKACGVIEAAKMPTPFGNRMMGLLQTAVYEAVNSITKRYPESGLGLKAADGASIEAAVAAANRTILTKFVPSQKEQVESHYQRMISAIPDGNSKAAGVALGEQAATAVLASRANDNAEPNETYRPPTAAGKYIPTVIPVFSFWPKRTPWVMKSADQFRPGPPPDLKSEIWTRDYNEIKSLGIKKGSRRTPEQTGIAAFWETTGPTIYFPVVLSIANTPGREVTQNARLMAMIGQAIDDAIVSVFDAKYTYNFWRPMTAIRNGDIDGNDATERDPSWTPFIETPMHPEYPCAHCIVASTVGTVLKAEIGNSPLPMLSTISPTAPGVTRRWTTIDEFVREVSEARICDGVHYRNSTEVSNEMGKKIGELAVKKFKQKH